MKAIILAAGEWTRLRPLTYSMPKAMVTVWGKTLLEHNLDRLISSVDEFIIVIKYKKEAIVEHLGNEYHWIKITYHVQWDEKGTWAAVKGIETTWDVVIAYADAIISQQDVDNVMRCPYFAVLVKEVSNPEKYGIFKIDKDGFALQIIEKPKEYVGNLANFSFFKVNSSILEIVKHIPLSPRGEIEITDAINEFVKTNKMKCIHLEKDLIDITSLQDLEKANKEYLPVPKLWEAKLLENIGELELYLGILEEHIPKIIQYSNDLQDEGLQKNTSDQKRFSTLETLEKWYQDKNRYTFTLVSKEGNIAGLVFYRPCLPPVITEVWDQSLVKLLEENSDSIHTQWARIYPAFRGQWLARSFIFTSEKYYRMIFPTGIISIDIDTENIASQKSFQKAGYQFVGYGENQKSVQNETHKRMIYVKSVKV